MTLDQIQTELCSSGIGKVRSPIDLLRLIAQLDSSRQVNGGGNDAYVTDWLARVDAAGGAAPSQTTIDALNEFCATLRGNGLDTLMVSMNPIVPDNIIAAITPLIKTHGHDSWTNVGDIADLTVDGLANPTSGYLETGVHPFAAFSDSAGVSIYIFDHLLSDGTFECGASNGDGSEQLVFYPNLSAISYYDCFDTVDGRVSGSSPILDGFFIGNRTSPAFSYIATANSSNPFAVLDSIATSGGAPLDIDFWFFTRNQDGSPGSISNRRYSFFALHQGLTEMQSQALYDAVVSLRLALGGGTV